MSSYATVLYSKLLNKPSLQFYSRPTSWELKETLEGAQEDVDSYLEVAKLICSSVNVFDPTDEEIGEEEVYEEMYDDLALSLGEPSEFYEELPSDEQADEIISHKMGISLSATTVTKVKSNLQINSKVSTHKQSV